MSNFPTYKYEEEAKNNGFKFIAGVDEVGRGAGSGPVVSAAVRIPEKHFNDKFISEIKDSKKLSPKKREKLSKEIIEVCGYGIGMISNEIIDEINILEATKLAMIKAISDLKCVDYVLIDGPVILRNLELPQQQIIKGDTLSLSIAAASIVAKVTRDRMMQELHNIYPIYGWDSNKGYLTKKHIEALKIYGACEFHRLSFNKVL